MKNNQKVLANMVLIVLLVLLVGAVSYYAWSNKANKPNNNQFSNTTTMVPTDWKTYTNTQYGFEFKYPLNWSIDTSESGLYIKSPYIYGLDMMSSPHYSEAQYFQIRISNETIPNLAKEFFAEAKSGDSAIKLISDRTVTFTGIPDREIDFTEPDFNNNNDILNSEVIFFSKAGKSFQILSSDNYEHTYESKLIRSTFKFTK